MIRDRHAPQPDGAWFDAKRAAAAVAFFERHLRHSVGEHAGKPFLLQPWQQAWVEDVWGWRRESDGTRLYRRTFGAVPRKNGKTTTAAGFGLALLIGDGEPGAQVYSIAGNADQARIVYDEALAMVGQSPALARRCELLKTAIYVPELRAVMRPLAGKGRTQHGKNPHGVIGDELHTWRGREQYEAMSTALGARRQPLEVYITTAGDDPDSLCGELWTYAENVRDGVIEDPAFYPLIFAASPDDDWTSPATWRKANPNLGVSVYEEYLAELCRRAQSLPGEELSFKRLFLNLWVQAAQKWLSWQAWTDPRNAAPFDEAELVGRPCWMGIDLASHLDMCALALVFPPQGPDRSWRVILRYFLPTDFDGRTGEAGLAERAKRWTAPFDRWAKAGAVTATEGEIHDLEAVEAEAVRLVERYQPKQVGFDRYHAHTLVVNLQKRGVDVVALGQGAPTLALPCDMLEAAVIGGRFRHGNHPVLNWNASNVGVQRDPGGKALKPMRGGPKRPHDGISAILNGMALALGEQPQEFVYTGM